MRVILWQLGLGSSKYKLDMENGAIIYCTNDFQDLYICTISVSLCYQAFAIAGSLTAVFTRLLWILSGFSHTHWPAGFSDYSKLLTKISNKFLKRVHQFLWVRFRSTWLFCPRRSVFAQWQNDCTDTRINVKNIVINVAEADKNGERFPCHFVIKRPLATLMLMLMKLGWQIDYV